MNHSLMINAIQQHAVMVFSSLIIALVLTIIIALLLLNRHNWLNRLIYLFSLLYSIPSFAFFALLLPVSGLGMRTAIIVLTIYTEYILLRSFITGIQGVKPQLIEIAAAMGMTKIQIFYRIQLPLALPAIFSGIKVALASTMAMATIAATINAGGLGQLLFEGLQSQQVVPILWGIILTVLLTLISSGIVNVIEKILIGSWKKDNF